MKKYILFPSFPIPLTFPFIDSYTVLLISLIFELKNRKILSHLLLTFLSQSRDITVIAPMPNVNSVARSFDFYSCEQSAYKLSAM